MQFLIAVTDLGEYIPIAVEWKDTKRWGGEEEILHKWVSQTCGQGKINAVKRGSYRYLSFSQLCSTKS